MNKSHPSWLADSLREKINCCWEPLRCEGLFVMEHFHSSSWLMHLPLKVQTLYHGLCAVYPAHLSHLILCHPLFLTHNISATAAFLALEHTTEHYSHLKPLFFIFLFFYSCTRSTWMFPARGWIGAAAARLHHNHGNEGSKTHLQPMLQLVAAPEP